MEKLTEAWMRKLGRLLEADMPEIPCGSFCMAPADGICNGSIEEHKTGEFAATLFKMLLNRHITYTWHTMQESRLLFFTDGMGYSLGHKKAFDAVAALPKRRDVLLPEIRSRRLAGPALVLRRFAAVLRWEKRRKQAGLSRRELLYSAPFLLSAWDFYCEFCRTDFTRYRLVTVYFDLAPTAAVLVALCRRQGVRTATLQHGMYQPAPRAGKAPGANFYHLTVAELFLAWNKLAAAQANADGLAPERIRVLGVTRFEPVSVCEQKKDSGLFGVVFSLNPEEDTALLAVANKLAAQTGKRYYTRYHPNQEADAYAALIEPRHWAGDLAPQEYSLQAYAARVDFSLVGGSSVLAELVRMHSRAYHYRGKKAENCYAALEAGAFSCAEQVQAYEAAPQQTQAALWDALCSVTDSAASYKNFFEDAAKE